MAMTEKGGNREAIVVESMTDDQRADLAASRPTAEEIAAARWADEPHTTREKVRRAKLRLPFPT